MIASRTRKPAKRKPDLPPRDDAPLPPVNRRIRNRPIAPAPAGPRGRTRAKPQPVVDDDAGVPAPDPSAMNVPAASALWRVHKRQRVRCPECGHPFRVPQ